MDYKHWISKWQNENIFNVENDRNKPKSYVFSFFPKGNQNGFQGGNFRSIVMADIVARYKRQIGCNVLFPTGVDTLAYTAFIESKRQYQGLTDDLANTFYDDMLELGVGINTLKYIDLRHNQFMELLQGSVIELYKKNIVTYQNKKVYFDKNNKKIYDDREHHNLPTINQDCFCLNISTYKDKIIEQINNLEPILASKLIAKLNPKRVMKLNILLSNGMQLSYETESPEYLAGLSFILLNPEYYDLTIYSTYDEFYSIEEYLDGKTDKFGVFSGIVATNPLTGKEIPVFISLLYNDPVYFGNPGIDEDDLALAKNEEISYLEIISNDKLINSDFLSGNTPKDARNIIFDEFINADLASERIEYADELLISQLDTFGALFPFLLDEESKALYSLDNHLPYIFSSKLRPILPSDVDIIGSSISETMNSSFVNGFLIILSILYDSLGAQESLFSHDTAFELNNWITLDFIAINESDLDSILYSICLYTILCQENNIKNKTLFNKIIIYNSVVDEKNREIKKNNNNLINLKEILKNNHHDSLRLLMCDASINDDVVFYSDLLDYNKLIDKLLKLSNSTTLENKALDFKFYQIKKAINDSLNAYDINKYYNLIKEFILSLDTSFSEKQLKEFLILCYPLMPFTCEDIYEKLTGSKYSLVNEDWPE